MPYSEGAMGSRNSNTGVGRRTKLGMALERSAEEILAHVKGDARLPARRIVLPDKVDVKHVPRLSLAESIRRHIDPLVVWNSGFRHAKLSGVPRSSASD